MKKNFYIVFKRNNECVVIFIYEMRERLRNT